MEGEQRHKDGHDGRSDVNPAARHDAVQPPAGGKEAVREKEAQVPPVQEEPLDPLGPGGIGS